ncbi:hypothetical protein FO519_001324 [Halicephalobus sp. NKZ332]|nr:hypothetical protein FO519_001324 [Halicephalobus sp. NKZ332]
MDKESGSSEKEVTNNPVEDMEEGELPGDEIKESTSSASNKKPSPEDKLEEENNEDEDQDDSGSTEDEDDEEDEEAVDDGHPRLIPSERKSLPPPKSAALSATENDVFAFHSSPEDEGTPSKKFKRESPSERFASGQYNAEEDDEAESRLQIDEDDEGDDGEPEEDNAESKKVPPLRILLPKTPSDEEDGGQEEIQEQPEQKPIPHLKKPGKGKKNASHHPSRLTRARVRQAVEEGAPAKRRNWRTGSSLIANADFEYEDYSLSPGLGADEDSQECETRQLLPPVPPPVRAWEMIQEDEFKGQAGLKKLIVDLYQQQFQKSIDDRPPEPEIPNYETFMVNVKDYFLKGREHFEPLPPQINSILRKWPLPIRNLWIKQEKQRRLKSTEHEKERVRLQTFGEREYLRAVRSTILRERGDISIIRLLRDDDACNPIIYDSFRPEPETPSMVPETVEQTMEKINKMTNKLKDKHVMEVKSLHHLQKLEMEKLLKDNEFIPEDLDIDKCAIPMVKVLPVDFSYFEPMRSVEIKKPGPVLPPPEVIQALGLEEEKFEDPPKESILLNVKKEEPKEES